MMMMTAEDKDDDDDFIYKASISTNYQMLTALI
jgi:hypothetical protein